MQKLNDRTFATVAWAGAGVAVFVFAVVMLGVFGGSRFWTNGKEIRTPASGAPVRRILWLPAQPLPGASDTDQYEPKVSADGLTMVFVRKRAGGGGSNADLFEARWTPNGWSEARPIDAINTEKDELGPELSRDGTELYFYSDRAGGLGGYDIWVSKREVRERDSAAGNSETPSDIAPQSLRDATSPFGKGGGRRQADADGALKSTESSEPSNTSNTSDTSKTNNTRKTNTTGGWGEPINLGAAVNSTANEYGPALGADGKTLYFASNRLRAGEPVRDSDTWPATMREKRSRHDYDLYVARVAGEAANGGGWTAAVSLEALNTTFDEGAPAASPAGDFLYFASDRPGGLGGFDLYRCRVLDERIGVPENLGAAVNSKQNDLDAGLSADGFRLYFSSDRGVGSGAESKQVEKPSGMEPPRYALWSTASREVFVEVESGNQLARLWNLILPLLPWIGALLLALIPLALLIWMLRNELWRRRLGRLSLLAQCLLISLLIHAAITAGLAVCKVGSGIAEAVRTNGGGTRVILASSGGGGDIGGQLGAPATQVSFELPPLAMVGMEKPIESVIEAPSAVALPAASAPVQERMDVRSEASPESRVVEMSSPQVPVSATPAISAATPTAERQAQAREVSGEPMRAAEVRAAAPVAMKAVTAPTVEMPRTSATQAARLDGAASIATESSRASEREASEVSPASANLPSVANATEGASAPLPRALNRESGATAKEATLGGPAAAIGAPMAAPAPAFAANTQKVDVALPTMTGAGESTKMSGAAIGMESAAVSNDAGTVTSGSAPIAAQGQRVDAQLPASAAPKRGSEAGTGEATLSRSEIGVGVGTGKALAPVAISGPKGVDAGSVALPSGSSGVKAERMSTSGFGGVAEPLASLGGVAFDASMLGVSPGGLGSSRLPADIAEPVKPLDTQEQRQPESRGELLARMGGSVETEKAVGRALEWFTKHQEADGRWSGKNFDAHCGKCAGNAEIDADAAMTGIVLLCYLGAGHTHVAEGPYQQVVAKALKWLVDRQAASGDLRRGETMYGQTLSTVALCEALAMTKDQRLTAPTRRAVDFVLRTAANQNRATREEDTSVLGWLVMTVESARRAGIVVPRDVFEGAGRWLEQASSSGAPGRYSYSRGGPASAAMTAEAMFVQQILGHSRDEARMKESAAFILSQPPVWDGAAPTYHWYYATLALFQQQGDEWDRWNRQLSPILVEHQRRDGAAAGSWDPQDEWSRLGGRLYQTAVCTLSLEVYYRYKPK